VGAAGLYIRGDVLSRFCTKYARFFPYFTIEQKANIGYAFCIGGETLSCGLQTKTDDTHAVMCGVWSFIEVLVSGG
jgi:hypothetical protein